jgi:predicted  nucleic acid-binding Zn-ribbon protein
MKETPLSKLIGLRKIAYAILEKEKEPKFDARDEELDALRKYNQLLQDKIKTNEEIFAKNLNGMRHEIESRDKEILKLHQELSIKEIEKNKIQKDFIEIQHQISNIVQEKEDIIKSHYQEISDLKLKHDQEVYILKKIKKNT